MKRELPIGIAGLMAVIMLVEYFFKVPWLQNFAKDLRDWSTIVSAFALAFAAVNLTLLHTRNIAIKRSGWQYSIVMIACMFSFVVFGVFFGRTSAGFKFLWDAGLVPLGSAFYAMLVFQIATASYRSFRARNVDAALLLIAGVLVMLGKAPVGAAMWGGFVPITDWIMNVPNLAANRGIMIGAALGTVATGLRIMLGLDRAYLGRSD
ncbi:MAG: hypothetical protein Q8P50_03965 [Bacillota bacterium]|nr:hypothetical protein [Bacillota bacterium]